MLRRISLVLALFAFWLLLSGHYTPFLLAAGFASSVLIVWFSDRLMSVVDREGHPIHLTFSAFTYWPWLLWEIAKSAWDVTKRILNPALPISPVLVRLKASQRGAAGRVTYANSITLTPGTITMELEGDDLLVHALTREGAESLKGGDMDRRVCRFEGSR
jgi:multicomponent Na+:H+ antiporter subunit E